MKAPSDFELLLSHAAHATLERAARDAVRESCGCLVGSRDGRTWHIAEARVGRNLARRPEHRFELDPGDVVRAEDEARRVQLELLGFWHSHPGASAAPSPDDEHMTWGDRPAVIVCAAPGARRMRAWRRGPRGWIEGVIRFAEAPAGTLRRSAAPHASPG